VRNGAPAAALLALLLLPSEGWAQSAVPDPLQLPQATTLQVPLTTAYAALGVPSRSAGSSYLDPTTGIRVYKVTSATFPAASANWSHDYSEGGDEVSLPHTGQTRSVLVRQNGGSWWLLDFTPGTGVQNPRQLTGDLAPFMDLAFTFSNNPATPYYAYVSRGSTIRRFDVRTMTEVPGNGWPVTGETSAMWMHQAENDSFFTWMRGANGTTIVGYEPASGLRKTYTNPNLNEPRIDRAGRYVGISMSGNGLVVWDWLTNSVAWSTPGDPGIPFAHNASLKRRWMSVDWNDSYPPDFSVFSSDVPNSAQHVGGPANGTLIHGNGNWIQATPDLDDQWALFVHYGSLRPAESYWLSPGGMVLVTPNGGRRLLAHPYNTSSNYSFYSFAKLSPDGRYAMFTSNMNGSARSDVFLAELPVAAGGPDLVPPVVSLTAPAPSVIVSGTAVAVAATASDNVGVAGVQFKLDGANLGVEDTTAPYGIAWDSTLASNGLHAVTAVARDTAGNVTTSAGVTLTVDNVDGTPPLISFVSASSVSGTAATIAWTTNEPASSQVEYGPTTAYGSSTVLDASLVTSHSQALAGLTPDTLYHYRLKSRDAAGNLAVSADYTFATLTGLNNGLLSHLALDEGSGTSAADSSGNGNAGTLVNGAAWAAGRSGQAVTVDGVDDFVSVTHMPGLDALPLTLSAWFKTTTAAGVRGLVNKYVAGSFNGYQLFFNDGVLCAWYLRDSGNYVYDGSGCTLGTSGTNDGLWHHVAFVVDSQGGRLYVDGVQRAAQPWTGAAGPVTTTQDVRLGHYPGAFGGAEYLAGTIDDVRLYGRALSGAEVADLFDATVDAAPAVSLTSPAAGQTVSGTITLSASASDDVGVAGVRFRLDGADLGAEDVAAPFGVSWNTTLVPNGPHTLSAVARDTSGQTTMTSLSVTVGNDTTAPSVSAVVASAITSSGAAITWTTNEASDSQVEYGTTTAYGSTTPLDASLVTAHSRSVSGLAPGTLYHYRVKSRDAASNLAVSSDFTFTTSGGPSLPSGLIAHWKLDEGSGTAAADSSGNGRTGTLQNGASWVGGTTGQALGLDGVNDHVRVAHATALNAYPLSAAVWFRTTTTTGSRGLVNKYSSGSYNGYQIFFNNGTLCAWYLRSTSQYVYDGSGCTLGTTGANDGAWHQAVFVVDAQGGRLYLDGVQRASRAWTGSAGPATTSQGIRLGHYPGASGSSRYLPGAVDEARLYNRALSAAEVSALYEATRPATP
jgi:hypothetical protein